MFQDSDPERPVEAADTDTDNRPSGEFIAALMEALPTLRGAAYLMARTKADADDLLQATAVRALAAHRQFTLGTNIRAWLYRIMHNEFIDFTRLRGRHSVAFEDVPEELIKCAGNQEEVLRLRDVVRAMRALNHLSSTVGSEAWNSRDLKSRPH